MIPIRHLNQIIRSVETAQLEKISKRALHRYIDQLQLQLASLHQTISTTYFSIQEEQPLKSKKKKSKSKKPTKKSKAIAVKGTHSAAAAN
jgi:hypothetical protein